jgi:alkyl sulfatase BDS1-like metallo-beta-lactamase superfamily hydrolase
MADNIADQIPDDDLSAVDASVLTRLVSAASPEQLDAALADEKLRGRLLDEIFRRMGSYVRADKAKGVHAVINWRLTGGSDQDGYDRYQCVLSDGTFTVSREMTEQPRVTITLSPTDFIRLIARQTSPAVLFVTGKLQVNGDLGFAAGLIGYFDLPTA